VLGQVRKEIPDVLFVIAGEGPARKSLEQETEELGLNQNVKFIGYLDRHTELNSCYRSADIFIFSSRTETQGLVLLEAMAQCLPVVSTAELGTRDVLMEGMGVWIAREEPGDFSEKIIRMLRNAEVRKELGEAGRDYAYNWSASKQAGRMLDFYQAVLVQTVSGKHSLKLVSSGAESRTC
jgi:1,2-diacylglycerol 3-alpha-glucosyltransferase